METKAGDLDGLVSTSTKVMERTAEEVPAVEEAVVEDAPDPDEDDLDDLDGTAPPGRACRSLG